MNSEYHSRLNLSKSMHTEEFSARVFDAQYTLSEQCLSEIEYEFQQHGALHVINTGIDTVDSMCSIMPHISFAAHEQFSLGGRSSRLWQKKWVAPGLRLMDYYPSELFLLPNNEIQYRRTFPARILFFCLKPPKEHCGGRTFLHQAKNVVNHILVQNGGEALLNKLKTTGMTIETGFLDEHNSFKKTNYFQSWQERFETPSKETAITRCLSQQDEYDQAWWQEDTLMTRITLPIFINVSGEECFRFPRIALDAPCLQNGYRRFLYGNDELTTEEKNILLQAYLQTREGISWSLGDFILMDNVRYGHSRESFIGEREIFVGMSGCISLDAVHVALKKNSPPTRMLYGIITKSVKDERYVLPSPDITWQEKFSTRIFDAKGSLTDVRLQNINRQFKEFGALHVINTGITPLSPGCISDEILEALDFGEKDQFQWGGATCGRTQLRYLSKCMRETDQYPSDRMLLPHNEILYQRFMPERLLFFCEQAPEKNKGGKTFVHSAKQVEQFIKQSGKIGITLLDKIKQNGFLIETGFLDEHHPEKSKNYFRSWQDRFDSKMREEALIRCQQSVYQFDSCYWKKEEVTINGSFLYTLMTTVVIPGYKKDARNGQLYLLFPRIALNGPQTHNGYRRFPLGNNEELSPDEITVLLHAFWQSRQAWHYQSGDLLLVDNIRFGHARESFSGKRLVSASMAGLFWTDDISPPKVSS